MKYSKLLIPTTREVPAEAEIPSHRLMIRAGFARKLASGTYIYLTLGYRCLRKIEQIVREEMDAAGAQELDLPFVQPMELWEAREGSGRRAAYGETLGWFTDRHGRENVLAPTAEEVMTTLVANEVNSYKQLPLNLYQIKLKYRDEFRPRFGALRSREFTMKDAYSFHTSLESLDEMYQAMRTAYAKIFTRCGIPHVIVQAESGEIGGTGSEEFMVPCDAGEDIIVHTIDGDYAANIEKAAVDPLPKAPPSSDAPAIDEVHTPNVGSIEAVCNFLGTQPHEMIKTLVYWKTEPVLQAVLVELQDEIADLQGEIHRAEKAVAAIEDDNAEQTLDEKNHEEAAEAEARVQVLKDRLAERKEQLCKQYGELDVLVALVRGDHEVNDAKLKTALGGQSVELADETVIQRLTGAAMGFAGPMRLVEKVCKLVIDHGIAAMSIGTTGANKTDYHVRNVVPGRDFPLDGENVILADIRNAVEGDTHQGKPLVFSRGIEVGHIFKLGTKYSEKLNATYLDENGDNKPCIMGTYGIGVNRIFAAAIEAAHDENGCILPVSIAPFEVEVIPLNQDKPDVCETAERIYSELNADGADVLLDDRDQRPGVKFKDADLIGIPLRIVVGERGLKE
ncbi:MAG: proline--tRNA ligase, partial [Phycisphaerae bacterium]|nr:proline--tRNA ligase [Phycisphaerae bacterium]